MRAVFGPGTNMEMSIRAVEWLVYASTVEVRPRLTPPHTEEPVDEDRLYRYGIRSDVCTVVLQGRVSMRVGSEGFRAEAGAFSILARDTLKAGDEGMVDFSAHVSTPT